MDRQQHFDRALKAFGAEPDFADFQALLAGTVIGETVVFADKASCMR